MIWIGDIEIEILKKHCDKIYKNLSYKELKSKYEMLVIASDPESRMNVLSTPAKYFPINLNLSNEHVNNFMLKWLKHKPNEVPSLFYTDLVTNGAFEDNDENKKKYYAIIYKVLIAPPGALWIGGRKRRRTQKMKRRKGQTRRMTKLRRGRGRKTKRV